MQLEGSVSIITGGASGLGRATVEAFHARGGKVVIFDTNTVAGRELAERLGDRAAFINVDVVDERSVQAGVLETVERYGALHILVNYAGISKVAKTYGRNGVFPLDDFTQVIHVNLVGTFNVLRLAAERMGQNALIEGERGVIINTASVAAYEGQIGQAAYAASKGGIVSMTLPIARDLAPLGIRVNTIVPGLIHTPLFDSLGKEVIDALSAQVLNPPRLGRPAEVAHLAAAIVENAYINGECIRVDGGIRMQAR